MRLRDRPASADGGAVGLALAGKYRGTSLIRNHPPLGPYPRPMPRVLGGS